MAYCSRNESEKSQRSRGNGSRPSEGNLNNNNANTMNEEDYWNVPNQRNAAAKEWQNIKEIKPFEPKNNIQQNKEVDSQEDITTDKKINSLEEIWDMGAKMRFLKKVSKIPQVEKAINNNKDVVSDFKGNEISEKDFKENKHDGAIPSNKYGKSENETESCVPIKPVTNENDNFSHGIQDNFEKEFNENNQDVISKAHIENAIQSNNNWNSEPEFKSYVAIKPSINENDNFDSVIQSNCNWNSEPDTESYVPIKSTYENDNFGSGSRDNLRNYNDEENNNEMIENTKDIKPERENYIPPEPSNDESDIFGTGIPLGVNFEKLNQVQVDLSGNNLTTSVASFKDLKLDATLMENIAKSGYTKPTKIQEYSIPAIMSERDLMACAQTGSGKTAAFLIPILNKIICDPKDVIEGEHIEPQVVIISPTRELALQIFHEARKFAFKSEIKTAIAYGGTSTWHQLAQIRKGCHILVATPGRLNAFVKRGVIKFSSTRFVVLDEADRMLDMGFSSEMESILNHPTMVPTGERRTLMFSATFPEDIQGLARKFLQDYIFVTVGNVGSASTDVEQVVYEVEKARKRNKLIEILSEGETSGTLVFVETKLSADFIAAFLNQKNFRTTSIHGDRLQSGREEALRDFRSGKSHVMVATSVAARGLDIRSVRHVINYDLPQNIDDYVHRIGRTGRIGNLGKSTSFYDEQRDSGIAPKLARILEQAGQNVPDFLLYGKMEAQNDFSSFGGHDMRKDCDQVTVFEEEQWNV